MSTITSRRGSQAPKILKSFGDIASPARIIERRKIRQAYRIEEPEADATMYSTLVEFGFIDPPANTH